MNRVSGIYRSGTVVLDQPVDWPDGMQVKVVCESDVPSEGVEIRLDGSPWEDTPAAIQRWIEWFDTLEPVFIGQELERFEADLRSAREEQKAHLPKWQEKIDNLVK